MAEPFFVTCSKRYGRHPRPEVVAEWIGGDVVYARPLPTDRPSLALTVDGVSLRVPGAAPVFWHPGLTYRRVRRDQPDPIVRLLDLQPGETVLDGTLGMGFDARMLARAGARVLATEAQAAVAVFTAFGLYGHDPDAARRVHVIRADHRDWLREAADRSVDHVYLDPMFPEHRENAGPDLAPLRALPLAPRVEAPTLREALRVARRTVLIKLAPFEPPPAFEGLPPGELVGSKRVHFAAWRLQKAPT